jgi:tRNA modification GTPase
LIRAHRQDTIAAIATPPGAGGIGIIRISGDEALPILGQLFIPKDSSCEFQSHRLYYGHVEESASGKIIDEAMAVYMAPPKTYTREPVVEIHCHGSFIVLEHVLELILGCGARLADPGEFTKRAFLNGRIDLTQAEAVIDILAARTRKGADLAQEQLAGALCQRLDPVRAALSQARAVVEVAIDFPDEDVEIVNHQEMLVTMEQEVISPLKRLLAGADQGKLYRDGVSLVIAGLPNVGKSSLLNALLQEERALVTPVPGTTRDSIEETIDIDGIPVRIIDTAGIREDVGEVEELGIKRAKELVQRADLVLFLIDASRPVEEGDLALYQEMQGKPLLLVVNKIDLCGGALPDLRVFTSTRGEAHISAKELQGIDELKRAVFKEIVSGSGQWEEEACAPNLRHKAALARAVDAAQRISATLAAGLTYDLIAVDLQECLDYLAEIIGETTTEDILDVVFAEFCLGK